MKDKHLLRMLRHEVNSVLPAKDELFSKIQAVSVTPEKNNAIVVDKSNKPTTIKRNRLIVATACAMVLVFALMIAMPFIIYGRDGNNGSIQNTDIEESK